MDDDEARRERANARGARMILRKTTLGAGEIDLSPVSGAEAISLVAKLSRESWLLSGRPMPSYARAEIPVRFVPRRAR